MKFEDLNVLESDKDLTEEQLPWYLYRDSITKIIIEDEIHPKSTANWFKGMKNVTYVDLSADAAIAGTYKDFCFKNETLFPSRQLL